MLTRARLSLLLATIVVIGLLVFLFATLPLSGNAVSAAQPITKVLLRRHDRRKGPLSAAELAVLRGQQPTTGKRDLEDTTPKHVPIKIKIKAEKENAFRDLGNDQWLRDMEIEVKNTGNKPIYFLSLIVDLPEVTQADKKTMGWEVHFGRSALVSLEEPLKVEDIPINPGETHIFTLADRFVKGWERAVEDDHLPTPKRVRVLFQFMNFGDGTGLDTTTAVPVSKHTRVAETVRPKKYEPEKSSHWSLMAFNHSKEFKSLDELPAIRLANFLPDRSDAITVEANTGFDLCCPGTSCSWAKRAYTRCQCSPIDDTEIQDAPTVRFPACSEPATCYTLAWEWHWCEFPNTDGTKIKLSCAIPVFYACGTDPTATPSGSPAPSPSCDATTKPNSTNCYCGQGPDGGIWFCNCHDGNKPADYNAFPGTPSYAGCDPFTSTNNGGDCCVCTQPLCPDGTARNMATCQCPSPSPTPDDGGSGGSGGGGGGNSNQWPLLEKDDCVDFYYVHFISNDGGHTWQYDDREVYAGCYYLD